MTAPVALLSAKDYRRSQVAELLSCLPAARSSPNGRAPNELAVEGCNHSITASSRLQDQDKDKQAVSFTPLSFPDHVVKS